MLAALGAAHRGRGIGMLAARLGEGSNALPRAENWLGGTQSIMRDLLRLEKATLAGALRLPTCATSKRTGTFTSL